MSRLLMINLPHWPLSRSVLRLSLTFVFSLVILLCGLNPAYAEKPNKEIDWYQVEVIIFSQQDLFNEERHTKNIKLFFPQNIRQLLNSEQKEEATSTYGQGFRALSESAMKMIPHRNKLSRTPGYRVLFHKAWRQPGLGETQSPWVFIQGGNKTNGRHELEGSFRLVRNRYLHIQANVWKANFLPTGYQSAEPVASSSSTDIYSSGDNDGYTSTGQGMTSSLGSGQLQWPPLPALPVFNSEKERTGTEKDFIIERKVQNPYSLASNTPASDIVVLNQSTRVTRKELTYLDHPNMGAIILVTKY